MKISTNYLICISCVFFIFILSACTENPSKDSIQSAVKITKNGKKCGMTRGSFLGSWFDYYERGLSFADCEMWSESSSDLNKALSKRSVDKRRVYSLGMHLVTDYFPHRELGVALFYQKQYKAAEKEINISLSQFPTSKAEEYLKRIRQVTIKKQKKDTVSPYIDVQTPDNNIITKSSEVLLSGYVSDDNFIDSLIINDMPYRYVPTFVSVSGVPVRVARKVPKMDFKLNVPVKFNNGKGVINIVAKDISGNTTVKKINLTLDQQGPQISVQSLQKKNKDYHVVLNISDQKSKVKHLKINNKTIAITSKTVFDKKKKQKVNEVYIDELISGPFDKEHMLVIAVDDTGNETQANIKLDKKQVKANTAPINNTSDLAAPEIFLTKEFEHRSTLEKNAYIEGEVVSDSPITKLTINGENILNNNGQQIYFNYRSELKEGKNTFNLIAENQRKQKQQKTITIIRKLPPNRSLSERLKIAQFPFPCNSVSRSPCFVTNSFYEQLYTSLKSRKRFQITDKKQLHKLFDELGSCEDGISDECVIKVADNLVAKKIWEIDFANAMFAGNIIERTNSKGQIAIEISGRMINNQTREVLTSVDIYAEGIDKKKFTPFSKNMLTEISDAFPLLEAKVTQQLSDNKLQVTLTEKDQIWEKMPVLIYQKQKNKNCANANLVDVGESRSLVEFAKSQCNFAETQQYHIITR